MYRIKTTTSLGKVFLSPFVYIAEGLNERLDRLRRPVSNAGGQLEVVEVRDYPKGVEYDKQYDIMDAAFFKTHAEQATRQWEMWEDARREET